MYVHSIPSLVPSDIPGIDHATLAGHADGLDKLSVWQQSLAPGTGTPPHRHDCEEVVLCSQGTGALHIAGQVHPFGAQQTLVVPPNVDHQIVNIGEEPLQFVAVFSMSPVQAVFPDGDPIALPWRS